MTLRISAAVSNRIPAIAFPYGRDLHPGRIKKPESTARWVLGAILILSVLAVSARGLAGDIDYFEPLQKKLVKDGYGAGPLDKIYKDPRVQFDVKGISGFFKHRESKLNYDQFASGESIEKARNYMEAHKEDLSRAEKRYGVDREIITAILLVETRLGTFIGNRSVLNTLSTIAALSDPAIREAFWKQIADQSDVSKEKYENWVKRKSNWAYKELKAFLKYTAREKIDPNAINGSYAGAMGISQFLPSNILTLAKDGDNDGRIDLFAHPDAIASVANYLKRHGWYPEISREKARKVVWSYNHSKYYVTIIIKISDILKG